jgi:hypothetical protein
LKKAARRADRDPPSWFLRGGELRLRRFEWRIAIRLTDLLDFLVSRATGAEARRHDSKKKLVNLQLEGDFHHIHPNRHFVILSTLSGRELRSFQFSYN